MSSVLLKGKRILIIEDDQDNLAVASAILKNAGAVIESERRGDKAIEKIVQFVPVDTILLDLMLPGDISGYDVFDQLYALSELAAVPVIAITAAESGIEMPKARVKGFSGYISKPIRYATFVNTIAEIIGGSSIWLRN
jgi:CheY-like chemotaxis protein